MPKTKIEYELSVSFDEGSNCCDFNVDVREDTVTPGGDIIKSEYVEAHRFESYKEALEKYYELGVQYGHRYEFRDFAPPVVKTHATVHYYDEVSEHAEKFLNTLNEVKMALNIEP